jgi:hypothetical protein
MQPDFVILQPEAVTIQLEAPFPFTPALCPWERETIGSVGNGSPFREYPQTAETYSLSLGERVRVRGN